MLLPLTIEMPANALSKKGEENEAILHNLYTLILNFSKLTLLQIYTLQHTKKMEIRIREATTASQEAEGAYQSLACRAGSPSTKADPDRESYK